MRKLVPLPSRAPALRTVLLGAFVGGAVIACNNVDVGLVPRFVPTPEESMGACTFDPEAERLAFIRADVTLMRALSLQVSADNILSPNETLIQQADPMVVFRSPNSIQPVRFDYRWECDSSGFTNHGPLVLPAFDPTRPFCIDDRDDTTRDFVGFDVIPAGGGVINPGETGLIQIRPVTPQLIDAMLEVFQIARRASECCATGDCSQPESGVDPNQGVCAEVQALFDLTDPTGSLNVRNSADLLRFAPFAIYAPRDLSSNQPVPLNLRLAGRFEGIRPTGGLVTSTLWQEEVGFCVGCPGANNRCLEF